MKKIGKVARAISIMSHPIPHTNDSHSAQVILPQKQLGRKSDMYVISSKTRSYKRSLGHSLIHTLYKIFLYLIPGNIFVSGTCFAAPIPTI